MRSFGCSAFTWESAARTLGPIGQQRRSKTDPKHVAGACRRLGFPSTSIVIFSLLFQRPIVKPTSLELIIGHGHSTFPTNLITLRARFQLGVEYPEARTDAAGGNRKRSYPSPSGRWPSMGEYFVRSQLSSRKGELKGGRAPKVAGGWRKAPKFPWRSSRRTGCRGRCWPGRGIPWDRELSSRRPAVDHQCSRNRGRTPTSSKSAMPRREPTAHRPESAPGT